MDETKVDKIPVIRVSFQRPVGDNGGLVFETYLAQDAKIEEVNAVMDKLADAGVRQSLRAQVEAVELMIYNTRVEIERQGDALADIDRLYARKEALHRDNPRKRGEFVLSETEAKAREGTVRSIEMLQHRKSEQQDRLGELKYRLAGNPLKEAAE